MGANDKVLWVFSVAFIAIAAAALVVPVLRRKMDVFTSWNLFLVGAIIFTGFSGINCATRGHYLATYTGGDYTRYFLGTLLFYSATTATYFLFKAPRRLAGRTLLTWPKLSGWVLVILTVTLSAVGIFQRFPLQIPFIGQLLFQFSVATPLLAFACAFIAWYRSPSNPLLIGLMLLIGAYTVFLVLGVGGSRRYLMSALAVVPVSLYWTWLRYKPTPVVIGWLVTLTLVAVPVLKGYSEIRHRIGRPGQSGFARTVAVVKALPRAILSGGSNEGFMGQDSVESALLTIHMLHDNSNRLQVTPLHTIVFIISNPIPRSVWPDKPVGFGTTLPGVAKLYKQGINANLGVNVAGQCYFDGGPLVHLLYGFLFGAFLRYYDEQLVRQPGNPLLIGGLVFIAPQIIAFPRGGTETMGLQIFLGFFVAVMTGWIGRLVFGAGLAYPRTDHIVDYPVLRSPADWANWMQSYTGATVPTRRLYDDEPEYEPARGTAV